MQRRTGRMKGWRNIALAALLGLTIWQVVVWVTGLPHFILPSPLRVATAMWKSHEIIAEHSLVTLSEVLIGIAIGTALGMATAIQLAISASAREVMRPLLVFSQAVPVFALAPILTLWLGYGLWSKVAMAVLIIYFPVTSSFYDGLATTPRRFLDLAATMGATKWRQLFLIKVPAAAPSLFSGIRLAAVYAPIGATIGEWVGSSQGLGYLMLLASGRVKIDLMFASLLTLGVMSMGLYAIITVLLSRMTRFHS